MRKIDTIMFFALRRIVQFYSIIVLLLGRIFIYNIVNAHL